MRNATIQDLGGLHGETGLSVILYIVRALRDLSITVKRSSKYVKYLRLTKLERQSVEVRLD